MGLLLSELETSEATLWSNVVGLTTKQGQISDQLLSSSTSREAHPRELPQSSGGWARMHHCGCCTWPPIWAAWGCYSRGSIPCPVTGLWAGPLQAYLKGACNFDPKMTKKSWSFSSQKDHWALCWDFPTSPSPAFQLCTATVARIENMHTCLYVWSIWATHKNNRFSISAIFWNYYLGDSLMYLCHQGWRMRNSEETEWLCMGFVKMWASERVLPTQGRLRSAHAGALRGQLQLLGIVLCQRPECLSPLEAHVFI